ncbi:MAG: hypothetical protein NG740_07175, partial [Omnitrophica bacterium]|nr:hypothetical protein [Candidatus Omnitrophota bacterium]
INDGYDVATAFRFYRMRFNPMFIWRDTLSRGYRLLSRILLEEELKDSECGFKFFNRKKIMRLVDISRYNKWFWDTEIMTYCIYEGLKIKEIPGVFDRREDKTSSVHILKTVIAYFTNLVGFKLYLMKHKKRLFKLNHEIRSGDAAL